MGLESATYLSELDPANPTGLDPVSQGDDHIRLLKTVLQNQFPLLDASVSATDTEMNGLIGLDTNIQVQLDALTAAKAPIASPTFSGITTVDGLFRLNKGADVPSASTINLPTDGNYFEVTGNTTINGIASEGVGTVVTFRFNGTPILTNNFTSFSLPGGPSNIQVFSGDHATFVEYSTGNWRCINYTRLGVAPLQTNLLNTKVVEIGTWDMSLATGSATTVVPHGLTLSKIRTIDVLIREDNASSSSNLLNIDMAGIGNNYAFATVLNVNLGRATGGFFDNTSFDIMGDDGNRGWITIQYTD